MLVLGAGGGIGLASVDAAVALGAKVIAAASSPAKLEAALAMGATATIAYEEEDLKARAREISGGGVDVVIDPVGGRHSEPALRAMRTFGRLCVIGFASGPIATVPLNQVLLNNRTVVGVDWGMWAMGDLGANRELLAELVELVENGRLHPTVPEERPLDRGGGRDGRAARPLRRRQGRPRPLNGDVYGGVEHGPEGVELLGRVPAVLLEDALVAGVLDQPLAIDLHVAVVVEEGARRSRSPWPGPPPGPPDTRRRWPWSDRSG